MSSEPFVSRFIMATVPPGDDVYELFVRGADVIGAVNKITGVLSDGGVNFTSSHGQMDEDGKTFANAFFCTMGGAKLSPEDLKRRVEKLPFVTEVRLEPMKGGMYEKFMFPLKAMFAGRVLSVGASAFADMEERLTEIFGSAGGTMAYEQGKAYAESTIADLGSYMEKVGARWDLGNIQDLFRAQGWGVVGITETATGYEVSVKHPPVGKKEEGPGRFVVGMIIGMLEHYGQGHMAAEPVRKDAGTETFTFTVRKARRG